jgi:putative tryptophan/tyrosine transport system substrate-binding protein
LSARGQALAPAVGLPYRPAMDRRRFLVSFAGALAAPLAAEAQQAGKMWRIGLLDYASDPASSNRWTAFRDRLRELGYVEGQNVAFESRWSNAQKDRLPGLARELVNAKVDMIVTAGTVPQPKPINRERPFS